MSLYEAFQTETGTTANGGKTNVTSMSKCVDLFFLAGASRGKNITGPFMQALAENEDVAIRTLLWLRDVRGGAGERQLFRDLVKSLSHDKAARVLSRLPELGRWDDVLEFVGTRNEDQAISMVIEALKDENGLCAKWMPRQGEIANKLRKAMGLKTPKEFRKLLVSLSNTVEQKMCAKQWSEIEFGKLPSRAAGLYQNAFNKNAPAEYQSYKDGLSNGTEKVNAGAVYPYDVTRSLKNGDKAVANAQWTALPNYMEGSTERILPMVDVSGSMTFTPVTKGSSVYPLDVAISLGLYISERNEGIFKDTFLTFTSVPQMHQLKGTLEQRMQGFNSSAVVGYNTDIQKAFETLLETAVKAKLPQEEMPTKILVLSDMEFDDYSIKGTSVTAFHGAKQSYEAAGYELPQVVFWNLNGREGNIPVKQHETGTALVSGFSPSIMKSLLGDDNFTPEGVMMKTVMDSRYDY